MDLSLLQQFGAELRQAREAHGRTVDEIARQTRIHRRYLEAIEAGDASALPPGPYVPAFLREFARAVGLKVPQEFAITSSINHGLTTTTTQSAPIIRNQPGSNPFSAVGKAADETAKFAGSVAKTAVKTTGTVIKGVGDGVNDAVGVFTSRSLREEADLVRRERLGLAKFPDAEAATEDTASEQALLTQDSAPEPSVEAPAFERLSETSAELRPKAKAVKAPIIPLEISADDPISGNATLKLGKKSKKFPVTNVVILALLLVFGVVAYFAIGSMKEKKRGDTVQSTELTDEEQLPSAVQSAPEPTAEVATATPTVTAPIAAPSDSLKFTLRATDVVWVSIGPDDATPFRGELRAGETRTFTAADRFTVNIGNQKALEMTFNGTRLSNLPTIKNSGMVVRNLVLTKDRVSLNGTEVSTDAPVTKPTAPTTNVAAKNPSTTTVKKPLAQTTVKSTAVKPTTNSTTTVKKPIATTTTVKKKTVAPKPTTTIAPVEPKPAEAD
jgi:cytoskeletal protein RodZ